MRVITTDTITSIFESYKRMKGHKSTFLRKTNNHHVDLRM